MKHPRLRFYPSAEHESVHISGYYHDANPAVANRFDIELSHILRRIADSPKQFPVQDGRIRSARLRTFPVQVLFREAPDAIYILAVAHDKRKPGYWRGRLVS